MLLSKQKNSLQFDVSLFANRRAVAVSIIQFDNFIDQIRQSELLSCQSGKTEKQRFVYQLYFEEIESSNITSVRQYRFFVSPKLFRKE